jgi:hypothetical protein
MGIKLVPVPDSLLGLIDREWLLESQFTEADLRGEHGVRDGKRYRSLANSDDRRLEVRYYSEFNIEVHLHTKCGWFWSETRLIGYFRQGITKLKLACLAIAFEIPLPGCVGELEKEAAELANALTDE